MPEAWVHGPVFKELYQVMKNGFLKANLDKISDINVIEFLDIIYDFYGKYTGNELEFLTHVELLWQNARKGLARYESSNNKINDVDI